MSAVKHNTVTPVKASEIEARFSAVKAKSSPVKAVKASEIEDRFGASGS